MRIYYLEEPLSEEDLHFVAKDLELQTAPEQVRIPHVLPPLSTDSDYNDLCARHETLLRANLRHAGIDQDRGKQVAFVAPQDMHWYSALIRAIASETDCYPYVVQTAAQRDAIGNPGPTRVLDTHGLSGLKP